MRKLIVVKSFKQLAKTKNAQGVESADRFSFFEDQENFCIYTLKDGETVVKDPSGKITQVGEVKIGDEVISLEKEQTDNQGNPFKQFYYLSNAKVEDYVKRTVARNVDLQIDNATALVRAEHAKKLAEFSLEGAMATI
jgi:hypothetical protein